MLMELLASLNVEKEYREAELLARPVLNTIPLTQGTLCLSRANVHIESLPDQWHD